MQFEIGSTYHTTITGKPFSAYILDRTEHTLLYAGGSGVVHRVKIRKNENGEFFKVFPRNNYIVTAY